MRIRRDGREVTLAGNLQRVLLGVLLARANSIVSADALTEAMWGGRSGGRAAPNLHVHVHRLRRLLPDPERLNSEPGGYRLVVLPGELDSERFESLLDEAVEVRSYDPQRAVELIRKSLDLWSGEPFGGVDTALLSGEVHRLTERRVVGLEELYSAELACGRHGAVLGELGEQVRLHPLRELLHGLLMIALYRGGQQSRALAAYQSARRILIDELGQEPGPELRLIEQRILAGRPVDLGLLRPDTVLPAQLPHDIRGFHGREDELAMLDGLLAGDQSALIGAISGSGGVGKTTLAVRWAHQVRARFPDGQLYADLRGYGPESSLSPDDALAGFLRELGVDSAVIPGELAERAARFRTLVAGRRILVVLDNARTAEQVRPLLPGGSAALVLVTSRDSLTGLVAREGARRIPLDRFPHGEALGLLRGLVGARVDAEPDAATELVDRCARLPLALRIAAELINASPQHGIGILAAELADEQRALDVLDAGGDTATSVRAVFSWSYQRLSPDTARVFRLLGLHPGHDLDVYAVAALTGGDLSTTKSVVGTLLRANLLDETTAGRYQLHDLLRVYALTLCQSEDTDAERHTATGGLFEHYLHAVSTATEVVHGRVAPPRTDPPARPAVVHEFSCAEQAARWLDTERANLARITRYATRVGAWRTATELATALRRYLSLGGHHDEALAIYQAGVEAARQLGDLGVEGRGSRCIGSVHRRLGHLDKALEFMHHSYTCLQQAGHEREVRLQLIQLGVMSMWRGRYPEALDHLHRALAYAAELGEEGRAELIPAHTYLGHLLYLLGRYEAALEHLTEALDLAGGHNPGQRIDADAIIGWVYIAFARPDQARHHLERARSTAKETGNRFIEAWVHPLAHVYWRLGLRQDAFDCAENCLAVALGTPERLVEASVRNTLGELHRLNGAPTEALSQHHAARTVAEAIGIQYCHAQAHAGIGDAHHDLGDQDSARTHWQQAVSIYRRIGASAAETVQARLTSTG